MSVMRVMHEVILCIDTIDYITRIGLIGVIADNLCFALAAFAS